MKALIASILLFVTISQSRAQVDPCNRFDFGRCDRINGLCWGTGQGRHFCSCKAGYRNTARPFQTQNCEDINECDNNPCGTNAVCVNTPGSFRCDCRCGYVLDYTGLHCLVADQISDLCIYPSVCRRSESAPTFLPLTADFRVSNARDYMTDYFGGSQLNFLKLNRNTRTCTCEEGFELNYCGYCTDTNECSSNPCSGPGAECINNEGSYYCTCAEGSTLGPCGQRCYASWEIVPTACGSSGLPSLLTAAVSFETFRRPITLENYRRCPTGSREGTQVTQSFDLTGNGRTDVTMLWLCNTPRSGRQSSILISYEEGEASWEPWTCWTVCKATCWGGLQTRSRLCRNGLPSVGNCAGPATQKRSCYTGPRCPFRIRKDAETLTTAEINDLLQAMRRYKEDMGATGFHNAGCAHGWPFQCDRGNCCPHGAKVQFLSWHRTYVLYYEEGLSRYLNNKQLGIPYWNWLRPNRNPPALGWNRFFNGLPNPFASMTVLIDRTGSLRDIQRDATVNQQPLDFAERSWRTIALQKVEPHIMQEFAESVESGHGGPHVSVCNGANDRCLVSLGNLDFAGFDPLFMFHHSQVDRQWAIAQEKMENANNETWTVQNALEAFEPRSNFGRKQMPFGNLTISPFPLVQAVNTMRDSYYYQELTGVRYDSLARDGYPVQAQGRRLRGAGTEDLLIGHFFQSDTQNFYVNYYRDNGSPCNQMTTARRLGGVLRLGTSNDFNLTVVHTTIIERDEFTPFLLDDDLAIRACYTSNPDCRERCPELQRPRLNTMPDPNLIYYVPGTAVDIYKFDWSTGKRMPRLYINIDAKSHWIYFYGNRRNNIRQVRNYNDWLNCNSFGSRSVNCALQETGNQSGGACLLPAGIYYFIDSNANQCRAGLRLIVVSRLS